MIITDNGFDALFAANRIGASVRQKSRTQQDVVMDGCAARTHPLRLAGLIGNRTSKRDLIDKYVQSCPMPVLEVLPLIEDIRVSRVKGSLGCRVDDGSSWGMVEMDEAVEYVCDYYLNIADQLLAMPEGVVPTEVPDRELFSLLSDFYLSPEDRSEADRTERENRTERGESVRPLRTAQSSAVFDMAATWRVTQDMMFQGNFRAPPVDFAGKTVAITGPSRGGIGYETAQVLAERGATVLLCARNLEKAEKDATAIMEETGKKPKVFKCDVSSLASARACAEEILKEHPVLDVLINNAGAVFDESGTVDEVEITFATPLASVADETSDWNA
eukprot:g4063.t1